MADTELDMEFSKNSTRPQKLIKETRVNAETIERSIEHQSRVLDVAQKNLVNVYKNEKKVPVRVAPSYAKYFGRVMRVSINGISVAVRCDGNTVTLPESFAAEVLRRMSEMDKYDLRLNKMAKIERNIESSPGQLNFFG
jgi:hypothetical protein